MFLVIPGCKKSESPAGPPPPTTIQEAEPNDVSPQSLGTLGSTDLVVNGTAANASDVDRYAVTLSGLVTLHASVSWSGGGDLDLSVTNSNAIMLNHQDTGANPERCTLPSLQPGVYIIQVTSKSSSSTTYVLTIGPR